MDDVFRLVSPLDPTVVLDEAPIPDGLPVAWDIPLTADFNGDDVHDFVAYNPSAGTTVPHDAVIVDGATFEVIGALLEEPPMGVRSVGAVDVDGDGTAELISIERNDNGLLIDAWRPADGGVALVQSIYSGLPASDPSRDHVLLGDFDGDEQPDLAITWHDGSEPYWSEDGPQILTILGATSAGSAATVIESPHPAWARSAATVDIDGDGDNELVIAHSGDEIAVMDWQDGGFVLSELLALPAGYDSTMSRISVGVLTASHLAGLITNASHDDDPVLELRTVALFPSTVSPSFVPEIDIFDNPTIVDFNADKVDDLWDPYAGFYLSAWSQ